MPRNKLQDDQQQAPGHVQPRQEPRLFVPPKKKQTNSYDGASQSSKKSKKLNNSDV
jgi:hypothetical protein